MSPARMRAFSARLSRLRPAVVRGYASALAIYARHLRETGRPFPAPRGVISCAETLTAPVRELLSEVFECPVFDRYGSREFGLIASQCESGSYHVNTRGVWVEILNGGRPAAPGTPGRVVVTGLAARAMPLVRYDTGDVAEAAEPAPCPCGRGLPLMGPVHGRVSDFVVTPDGRLVHGEFFTHLFYGCRSVRSFAVRQDGRGDVTVSIAGEGPELAAEVEAALAAMARRLGSGVRIAARHVADLPAGPSGKRRFVISDLAAEQWRGAMAPSSETP
jgi:phenylacetate-CoA ligase